MFDRHFYLYAKGWYLEDNLIDDLEILCSKRSDIQKEFITENDIVTILTNLVDMHISLIDFIPKVIDMQTFNNYWDKKTKESLQTTLIKAMISVLRYVKAEDIPFDNIKPDKDVLPLSLR